MLIVIEDKAKKKKKEKINKNELEILKMLNYILIKLYIYFHHSNG